MHKSTLRSVGGSVMFAIPRAVLEGLSWAPNQQVGLSIHDGKLVVEGNTRPRYTLEDLISACDADAPMTDEDRDWLNAPESGREAL
jgi:antitoxin ChpS